MEEPHLSKVQAEFAKVADALTASDSFKHNESWMPHTHKISDPTFRSNLIEDENLVEFKSVLMHHVYEYTRMLGMEFEKSKVFRIQESWMTNTGKGEFAHIHHHHLSTDLSGAYYYKTSGDDGAIFFMNPCPMFSTFLLEHLKNTFTITPQVGKLLLFPSWLEHGVHINNTDHERISVSFNINFRR